MDQMKQKIRFDPDLPTANAVMASLCCVAAQYANKPSVELARLALELAHKLAMPQYTESKLITEVANQLIRQWNQVLLRQVQTKTFGVMMSNNRFIN